MCLQLILDLLPRFVPGAAGSHRATLMIFFLKQFQKDQKGNGSFECQDRPVLRSSENPSQDVGTVKDCKVQKQWAVLCDSHWPQKNSAEAMKVQQSINSILPTLLDRRLLDCEFDRPSCITYQDFPSLPKISVQSHGSHTAPGALLTSIKVALWVWQSMPSWLDSAPRLETFHIEARWSRKEKKETCQTKRKLEKQKEQGAGKESEGRRNNKLKNNEINGIQNRI